MQSNVNSSTVFLICPCYLKVIHTFSIRTVEMITHSHVSRVESNRQHQTGDLHWHYKPRDNLSHSTWLQGKYTGSGCALWFHLSTVCHVTCMLRNESPPLVVAHPDRAMTFCLWAMHSADNRLCLFSSVISMCWALLHELNINSATKNNSVCCFHLSSVRWGSRPRAAKLSETTSVKETWICGSKFDFWVKSNHHPYSE